MVEAAALGLIYQTAHLALIGRTRMQATLSLCSAHAVGSAWPRSACQGARRGDGHAGVRRVDAKVAVRAGADATFDLGGEGLRDGLRDAFAN